MELSAPILFGFDQSAFMMDLSMFPYYEPFWAGLDAFLFDQLKWE
ncbi:hypothetical protein [Polycladomyces zharkentensis]|nr:hypothetical protein [Polycladomyces sp. WAk]